VHLTSAERELCARLTRGAGVLTPELLVAARQHRLHLLLAHSIAHHAAAAHDPQSAALIRELRVAAALDARCEQDLIGLLDALAANDVDVLLLKGIGLAYTHYPAPHVRPRTDVDVLVRRDSVDGAEAVLAAHGWTRSIESDVELFAAQRHYARPGPAEVPFHIDLHWRIANPRVFADALTFDTLRARAIAVPPLGRAAWTLGNVDALLLACIHRVAHHEDQLDLLWLWDVHLLTERLSGEERERFLDLATRTAMTGVCTRGIHLASTLFPSSAAADLAAMLRAPATATFEPSARFIGGIRRVSVLREDLAALPDWRARARLVAEHLFPSLDYMRAQYPRWPAAVLPFAYADRIARGASDWFRRTKPSHRESA
jgi:hypothetical protein